MLFKIRIRLLCGQKYLEAWTDSIKVVAKLDSIRKKQAEREGASIAPRKNKRARADDLIDSLASIQEQQKLQSQLLNNLLVRMNSPERSPSSPYSPCPSPITTSSPTLESAFQHLLDVYSQTETSERPWKMRRLMDNLQSDQRRSAEELGCVLAEFTDSHSSKDDSELSPQAESTPDIWGSDLDAKEQEPTSTEPVTKTYQDIAPLEQDQSHSLQTIDSLSDTSDVDLESWNSVLHEFLTKDE